MILDALSSCTRLFFDKTGTLTTGKLSCNDINVVGGTLSEETLLQITAGLENGAHHPIADALLRFAKEKNVPHYEI
ncbi:hypothetical protein ACKI2E_44110, partial [Streptomyces galilaeus]